MTKEDNMSGYHEDLVRRIAKLEQSDDKMRDSLQQLIIATTKLTNTVENLAQLQPKVEKLEKEQINNTMVVNAVKWATITFIGSAISIFVSMYMKGQI